MGSLPLRLRSFGSGLVPGTGRSRLESFEIVRNRSALFATVCNRPESSPEPSDSSGIIRNQFRFHPVSNRSGWIQMIPDCFWLYLPAGTGSESCWNRPNPAPIFFPSFLPTTTVPHTHIHTHTVVDERWVLGVLVARCSYTGTPAASPSLLDHPLKPTTKRSECTCE